MEGSRSVFNILIGKPTGKISLGRPRRRWEDNIRMDLKERGMNTGNWIDSAQDRDYWRALLNPLSWKLDRSTRRNEIWTGVERPHKGHKKYPSVNPRR